MTWHWRASRRRACCPLAVLASRSCARRAQRLVVGTIDTNTSPSNEANTDSMTGLLATTSLVNLQEEQISLDNEVSTDAILSQQLDQNESAIGFPEDMDIDDFEFQRSDSPDVVSTI